MLLYKWERFRAGSSKTHGVVIGHWGKRRRGENYVYAPVVQFQDQYSGQLWTFHSPNYTSYRRRVGSVIAVAYRPEDPQQANIDTIGQRLIPLTIMLMGASACFLGIKAFF